MNDCFRYGVVIDSENLRAWQHACIQKLDGSGRARLSCVVRVAPAPGDSCGAVGRIIRRCVNGPPPPSQAAVGAIEAKTSPDSILEFSTEKDHQDSQLQTLEKLKLDFFLLFASFSGGLSFTEAARLGVWYFVHSDIERFESPIPCFWEIYFDHPVIGSALLRMTDHRSAGVLMKSGYFETVRSSLRESIDDVFASISAWPLQICQELQTVDFFPHREPIQKAPRRYDLPTGSQLFHFQMLQAANRVARYGRSRCWRTDWNIARLNGSPDSFIGRHSRANVMPLSRYRKGRFLADPCIVSFNSKTHLFCEDYSYDKSRGTIVCFEMSNGTLSDPKTAIERPFHLSYPQVFQHDGVMYCLPESSAERRACLYKALEYPFIWEFDRILLDDFAAVDSTVLFFNDRWWLFCTNGAATRKSGSSHLCIWYADTLFGPWRPHLKNPVKIDVRSARPAGAFFTSGGQWYRPAQDCSGTYGGGVTINKIDTLTATEFQESVVGTICPAAHGGYRVGIHTITSTATTCVVDVKRYVFDPASFLRLISSGTRAFARVLGFPKK